MQLAVLGFAAFILIFNIVISFTRGFRKSLLRLITVVLAVVAAYFAARAVAATAGREIVLWLEATLGGDPNFAPLFNGEVAAGDAVSLLVKLFVAPLLFLLLFVVIKALLIFLYWILCGVTRPKYADTCVSHFLGLPMGVAIAIIGITVFVTPLFGYADLLSAFATKTTEAGTNTALAQTVETYHQEFIAPLGDTPVLPTVYDLVGDTVFQGLSSGKWENEKVYLRDEFDVLGDIMAQLGLLGDKPVEQYGAAESAAAEKLAADISRSPMLSVLCSGVLNTASNHWLAGQTFLGVAAPSLGENGDLILYAFLEVFSTSTRENLGEDLDFFADVFGVLIDQELLTAIKSAEDEEAMAELIADGELLTEVQQLLKTHPRMNPVGVALVDVGMRAVLKSIGLPEDVLASHGELISEMSEALKNVGTTPEGAIDKEALSEDLGEVFTSYGVEVNEASTQLVAEAVADAFTPEELQSLTVDDVMTKIAERFGSVDVSHLLGSLS